MRLDKDDPKLMDYVLGELDTKEAEALATALEEEENKDAKVLVEELRGVAETTRRILHEDEGEPALSDEQREAIVGYVVAGSARWWGRASTWLAIAAMIAVVAAISVPNTQMWVRRDTEMAVAESTPSELSYSHGVGGGLAGSRGRDGSGVQSTGFQLQGDEAPTQFRGRGGRSRSASRSRGRLPALEGTLEIRGNYRDSDDSYDLNGGEDTAYVEQRTRLGTKADFTDDVSVYIEFDAYNNWGDSFRTNVPANLPMRTPALEEEDGDGLDVGNLSGQAGSTITAGRQRAMVAQVDRDKLLKGLAKNYADLVEDTEDNLAAPPEQWSYNQPGYGRIPSSDYFFQPGDGTGLALGADRNRMPWQWNTPDTKNTQIVGGPGTETYVKVTGVKPFSEVKAEPLSTFSIDVDTAAYSNVRRFLTNGHMPPADAVRIEEMLNYFDYDYPQPTDHHPFAVVVHGAPAPWDQNHRLVRIGVKGKEVAREERPPANLVFLLDVSGSMGDANKLPLVKESMKTLLINLTPRDRVGIVTYAG
ncbi:MAG: von Willebrand factor type A domain-containing protein, partial [Candidatus Hydrogenedentes bacterium]|nr:von Willebrand factor type A domain-containing protein [Candidatus Hydrogenedentota bacterium]